MISPPISASSRSSPETLAGHAGVALALGALYWLMSVSSRQPAVDHSEQPTTPATR
jgi:hypothetical protein